MLSSLFVRQAKVFFSWHHTNGISVALAATPALNTDDVIALADDTKLDTVRDGPLETPVNILLPALEVEVGLLLGEQERPYAAVQMGIPRSSSVTGDHDDRANRAIFGKETCSIPAGGQNYDSTSVQFKTCAYGSHGNGIGSRSRARDEVPQLIEDAKVRECNLSEKTCLVHHGDSFAWVATLSSLTRQHDTVCTVENGVGNVRHLGSSRARVICHGFQHLSCADDRLALDVTLGNHHLLGKEDLGCGNFDTQVTTGNHDAVSLLQDFIEVVNTLLILNLGNNLDLLALFTQDFTDVADITSTTNKRGENHVYLVLNTELEIGNILFGKSRKVNVGAWQVDTLLGRDVAVVQALATKVLLIYDFKHLKGEDTVVDIDELAGLDHLGDILIVEIHVDVVGAGGIFLIGCDIDHIALLDGVILVVNGVSGMNLRTLGVEGNGERATSLGLLGFAGIINDRLVILGSLEEVCGQALEMRQPTS